MKRDNATWLFERETSDAHFHHSSEHFWTSIFALFLLHLGARPDTQDRRVSVYRVKNSAKPVFGRPIEMQIGQVSFDDVAVEPGKVDSKYFGQNISLTAEERRCEPDLFVRFRSTSPPTHLIIENKTIRASFDGDQKSKYMKLLNGLERNGVRVHMLLLTSADPEDKSILPAAEDLQSRLLDGFAVLLWEDVIRQMRRSGFSLAGIDITQWQGYTGILDTAIE